MYFKINATLKEFSDWLSSHYFVRFQIIHKFELKTLDDGQQFYQWGTPKPPIFVLYIFVEEIESDLEIRILPRDKIDGDLIEIEIDNALTDLLVSAKLDFPDPTSLQPMVQ